MRDLKYFRPDYVVRHGNHEDRSLEAHRVVRNAVAIAGVLHSLPSSPTIRAMSAIERAETRDEEGYTLTPDDATILATVLEQVHAALRESLDRDWRPQGPRAKEILDEAALPIALPDGSQDLDRVFEVTADGSVALRYPRIPLCDLYQRLPEVTAFLRHAAAHGDVVLLDD